MVQLMSNPFTEAFLVDSIATTRSTSRKRLEFTVPRVTSVASTPSQEKLVNLCKIVIAHRAEIALLLLSVLYRHSNTAVRF